MATAPTSIHSVVNEESGLRKVVYPKSSLLFPKNGGPPRSGTEAILRNPPRNFLPEGAVAVPVAEAYKGIVGKLPNAIKKRITARNLAARNAGRGGRRKDRKSRKGRKNRK